MSLGKRISESRQAIGGLSVQKLADKMGVTREMVRRWEADLGEPRRSRIEVLAKMLETTPLYLEFGLTSADLAGDGNLRAAPTLHRYPLISEVQAGMWTDIVDNFLPGDAESWIASPYKASKNGFWLRVKGDSMEPRFAPGGHVLVDPEISADAGSFVVAKLTDNQQATFKKLTFDAGQWYLMPLNRQYQSIPINRESLRIIGRVVFYQPAGESL